MKKVLVTGASGFVGSHVVKLLAEKNISVLAVARNDDKAKRLFDKYKNIHIINAYTKKGRMEYIIFVDFPDESLEEISSLLALEFGTIGMKIINYEHIKFPYKIAHKRLTLNIQDVSFSQNIRIKYLYNLKEEIISLKVEYEDLKSFVNEVNSRGFDVSFSKLKTLIEAKAYSGSFDLDELSLSL